MRKSNNKRETKKKHSTSLKVCVCAFSYLTTTTTTKKKHNSDKEKGNDSSFWLKTEKYLQDYLIEVSKCDDVAQFNGEAFKIHELVKY